MNFDKFFEMMSEGMSTLKNKTLEVIESESSDNLIMDISNMDVPMKFKLQLFEAVCIDGENKNVSREEQIIKLQNFYDSLSCCNARGNCSIC